MAAMLTLTCALACDGTRGNEDGPGGTLVIPPEAVQLFGTSSSIAVVQDLEVLPDGRIWLLNSIEPFFLGFGPDGEITHEYGNQGGGPEEFRAPRGLVHGGIEGEAWVFDWSRNSLIRISQPEMDWTEITLPPEHVRPGTVIGGRDLTDNRVRLARLGDEVILPRTSAAMADGMMTFWLSIWGADLLALDVEEETIRPLMSLREVLGDPTSSVDMSADFPPFPMWFRLWAVCDDEQLRVYDRLRNEVRTFTGAAQELDPTPLPPPAFTRVTQREFARVVLGLMMAERMGTVGVQVSPEDSVRILNEALANVQGEPGQLAAFLPRYVDFRCDAEGTLWLRPMDLEVGGLRGGPNWLRITSDHEMREVRFPDRFDPFRFTADRVWGVQRDPFDVASVAWIDLDDVL